MNDKIKQEICENLSYGDHMCMNVFTLKIWKMILKNKILNFLNAGILLYQ